MPHLSCAQRLIIIKIFSSVKIQRGSRLYPKVKQIANDFYGIKISITGIFDIIKKWRKTGGVKDLVRENLHKRLITNSGLLAINKLLLINPFITCLQLKHKLALCAKTTIGKYCSMLGWKKVNTKYCQIVSPANQIKRFTYACCCKIYNETYDDVTDIDETTVEVRLATYKNWRKSSDVMSRAAGGKIGKPKHSNVKIHLLGGISRRGLTPLVIFAGNMCSVDFQHYLGIRVIPFIREKFPFRHRLYMDNDPKVI
jgi:hypothetical protein